VHSDPVTVEEHPSDIIVRTRSGAIRGRTSRSGFEFRGIPFARPPRGPLRFAPPVPIGSWSGGTLDATHFGDAAPQDPWEPPFGSLLRTRSSSEDCLNLNIWTPTVDPAEKRPVMVWIHGGGYADESGSDEPFHGHAFARDGVVLVTINYRLGVLGFLHVAESFGLDAGSGNFGTLDQLAALTWVQDHIAAFGGDPDNVTVFGESAGGWAVATLLASDRSRGLFRRAICQSGAGDHVLTPERAQRVTERYLELAGLRAGDVDGLRGLDRRRLLEAQGLLYADSLVGGAATEQLLGDAAGLLLCLMPVATGEVVADLPTTLITAGAGRDIDLMLGSNAEEYGLYRLFPGGVFSAEQMAATARAGLRRNGCDVAAVERWYRDRWGDNDFAVGEAMETDRFFRIPIVQLARGHAGSPGNTFLYELTWSPTPLGACHVMDVPLVFDDLTSPLGEALAGGEKSREIAEVVHGAWVQFATTGNPDPTGQLGWSQVTTSCAPSLLVSDRSVLDTSRDDTLLRRWGLDHG
jgi:para-nitrobenzyl esterase